MKSLKVLVENWFINLALSYWIELESYIEVRWFVSLLLLLLTFDSVTKLKINALKSRAENCPLANCEITKHEVRKPSRAAEFQVRSDPEFKIHPNNSVQLLKFKTHLILEHDVSLYPSPNFSLRTNYPRIVTRGSRGEKTSMKIPWTISWTSYRARYVIWEFFSRIYDTWIAIQKQKRYPKSFSRLSSL